MKVHEPEDPHESENLNSNHECHSCADSPAPPGNKRKGADIARSLFIPERAGTTLTWHLSIPHPTWEESLSHFLDSVSSAPDTQPSITCSERCWAASTQTTTLILFEQAGRPTTPPALLNVDIAHEAALFSVSKANIYQPV